MGKFLDDEKLRYMAWKTNALDLSSDARADGEYKNRPRPFCLPLQFAQENLFHTIPQSVCDYFAKFEIKWHDGTSGSPSNHLCDSQVCCVNFLFPFADQPHALATVLRPIYPNLAKMLPIENGQYVACEWIGQANYLGEKISRNGKRTRGANFTSADAVVLFERQDGAKQLVLIEWKYTESYSPTSLKFAKRRFEKVMIWQGGVA